MNSSASYAFLRLLIMLTVLVTSGCVSLQERPETTAPAADSAKTAAPPPTVEADPDEIAAPPPDKVAAAAPAATPSDEVETTPAPPADLWERLRSGMQFQFYEHPRVKSELRWLKNNPDYLERATQRATPFLFFILEEAQSRGLPFELALLPIVESGYQPLARSPDRAKGLWQFMPRTGRAFGLRRSWWYDGRSDVHASTHAAFDYLSSLAEQFDGDWYLALAAYNAGPGTVRRAIRRNQRKHRATDYWSLDLPRETRYYIPRLLAVARVVSEPEAFGVSLAPIPNQPVITRVELPGQIDLAIASRLSGLSQKRLQRLNPGLRRATSDPDGPHSLLLPLSHAERFRTELAAMDPKKLVTRHRYRIRQGDTLGGIAARHGVSVRQLQRANNLRGTRIRAGRFLLIPSGGAAVQVAQAQPEASSAHPAPHPAGMLQHVVQPGDTLWDIAQAHRTNHRTLAALNGLAVNATLRPGQTLTIKSLGAADAQRAFSYHVQRGDSLYLIARRFNVTIEDLRRWNRLPGRYLQPGQKLTLYLKETST